MARVVLGLDALALTFTVPIPQHTRQDAGDNERMVAETIRSSLARKVAKTLQRALAVSLLPAAPAAS